MTSFNRAILMGRLALDPEIRFTPLGVPVCEFTLAVEFVPREEGEPPGTDFIPARVRAREGEACYGHLKT